MGRTDHPRWDDRQLIGLAVEVFDDEDACRGGLTVSTQHHSPAHLPLADVIAAGQAAYCWLDVIVTLRNVTRHHGPVGGASPRLQPGR